MKENVLNRARSEGVSEWVSWGKTPLIPFACVSGWGRSRPCRWTQCPRCTPSPWWTDAGIGCCWGKWWRDAASGLRCSCSGCWKRSACGSSVRILQRAAFIRNWKKKIIPEEKGKRLFPLVYHYFQNLTVTLESLSDQPEQHLPAVIAEGRGPVRVHVERMWTNLEVFRLCRRWSRKPEERVERLWVSWYNLAWPGKDQRALRNQDGKLEQLPPLQSRQWKNR